MCGIFSPPQHHMLSEVEEHAAQRMQPTEDHVAEQESCVVIALNQPMTCYDCWVKKRSCSAAEAAK